MNNETISSASPASPLVPASSASDASQPDPGAPGPHADAASANTAVETTQTATRIHNADNIPVNVFWTAHGVAIVLMAVAVLCIVLAKGPRRIHAALATHQDLGSKGIKE